MTNSKAHNHPFSNEGEWQKLLSTIREIAKVEVLARFEQVSAEEKADGSLLTEADTEMQNKTQAFLESNWPQYAFLGEESSQSEQESAMNSDAGCWILDPVDGTSNFAIGIPVYSPAVVVVTRHVQREVVSHFMEEGGIRKGPLHTLVPSCECHWIGVPDGIHTPREAGISQHYLVERSVWKK
ncbi:MAG: inositol monophosphatase family protein, partial [Thiomicrorhabdus sp.]|nr:inositol monophosphatase family protein [Thiomicrorhabdus sp.]